MSPEYFATRLTPYEAEAYLDGVMMRKRDGWEQTRELLKPYMKEGSQPWVFPWETERMAPPKREEIEDTLKWAAAVAAKMNLKHG